MSNPSLSTHLQQWLQHAPAPPERGRNSYDAFISYRSSDRAWALALYDALKLAGWDAFLDQYELVPGSNLEQSLTEALEASSSGVILWSSRTKDSKWCQRERDAMRTLRDRDAGFHFLFAKLDAEDLPLFAHADLYIDFAASPEGPRGEQLLRLLCGMKGVPLPPEAVELAQRVDEDVKAAMVSVRAAVDAENPARLREIGMSSDPGVLSSPLPMLEAAQGLISMRRVDEALEVLRNAETYYPKSIRAKQLKGLALRRKGDYQEAINTLSELKAAGHQDPETLGMLAAAWHGRYKTSGKKLDLRRSRQLYRTAFQGDPTDYYTGVNAAAKSLFLGEADEAAKLAAQVQLLVQHSSDGKDFWAGCTLAEVYLLQGNAPAAGTQYQTMVDSFPGRVGDLRGTQSQAQDICAALRLSDDETRAALAPFDDLPD